VEARRLEVGHVVLGEVEARPRKEARLEGADGGEDPAGAVVVLKADAGDAAVRAQVVLRREAHPLPRWGGGGRHGGGREERRGRGGSAERRQRRGATETQPHVRSPSMPHRIHADGVR
jgi:hypothetical protein